jgi:hypothetical protein
MPIPLPNLDDRTYTDLVTEAQAMIPTVYPTWTNYNPSDPGIVLIELLAWLTEMALYQVNEITAGHTEAFLELLNGPAWSLSSVGDMDLAIEQTLLALRERYRAVTSDDFVHLLTHVWPQTRTDQDVASQGEIARICCLPNRDLTANDPTADAPAHVSLVILPQGALTPQGALLEAIWAFLDKRRLLTVILHMVKPDYVPVTVQGRIYIREDVLLQDAVDALGGPELGLAAFFDPHTGGPDHTGWPFGRSVYVSEIYAILSQLAVVDYVDDVQVIGPDNQPDPVSVDIQPHQLVQIDLAGLVAVDIYGNELKVQVTT